MRPSAPRVVVTGIGVVSPLGRTPLEMWERLVAGESSARAWEDLAADGYRAATACRVEDFECPPLRRGRSLALTAAQCAVEEAGFRLPDDTGVYVGSTIGESLAFERAAEGERVTLRDFTVESFARAIRDHFHLAGPTQALATACAAGNYAVGAALSALRDGRISAAIAGGVEPFSRLAMAGFSRSRAMASSVCRPFDRNRTGMLLGEGAALFVLERAEDAVRRGAVPLAEVAALGLSCDAYHATAPQPDGRGALTAMHSALRCAHVDPADIDWVNAHGSGTKISDIAEGRALRALFGDRVPTVSGSKGALGHALGASSALELAVCIQGLLAQVVPPTAGHEVPDPECGIACSRAPVARTIRWVLNNAFAFGGINSTLLIRRWDA